MRDFFETEGGQILFTILFLTILCFGCIWAGLALHERYREPAQICNTTTICLPDPRDHRGEH